MRMLPIPTRIKEVIFEVRNLSRKDQKVKNVSFKLHKGKSSDSRDLSVPAEVK